MKLAALWGSLILILIALPIYADNWKQVSVLADQISFEYPANWVVDMDTDKEFSVSHHDEEALFPEAFSLSIEELTEEERGLDLEEYVDKALQNITESIAGNEGDSSFVEGRSTQRMDEKDVCMINLSMRLLGIYSLKVDLLVNKQENHVILGMLTYDIERAEINSEIFKRLLGSIRFN